MTKENVAGVSRLLPSSVTLLTVGTKKEQDAMTASAMFVSETPPLLTVSVAKHIVSHDLIEKAGEFALNVATAAQVKLARQLGFTHGSQVDKFKRFAIRTTRANKIRSPLIKDSYPIFFPCCFVSVNSRFVYSARVRFCFFASFLSALLMPVLYWTAFFGLAVICVESPMFSAVFLNTSFRSESCFFSSFSSVGRLMANLAKSKDAKGKRNSTAW